MGASSKATSGSTGDSETNRAAESEFDLDNLPPFLTIKQTAQILGISKSTAYNHARLFRESGGRRGLPCTRVGPIRIPSAVLRRFASVDLRD